MDENITRHALLRLAGLGAIGGATTDSRPIEGDASFLYVSPTGNDANDGKTWAKAKRQISSAVSPPGRFEGVIWVAPGSYSPFSLIGPDNRISVIGLGDVKVIPTNGEIGILIDNSAGTPLVGPLVENILVAGDGAGGSTIGIRLKNALRSTVRRCRVANCLVGVDLYNHASGFTERNAIENTLINNCGTGIRYYRTATGAASFSYNNFVNVGVDFCPTGIDIGSVSPAIPSPFTNSYVNVVVWGHSDNDVLVKIAGDILGCVLQLNLERLSGANVVGYDVQANAARTLEATIFTKFVGSFGDKVRLASGKELRWIEGRNVCMASASNPNYEQYLREGDTSPRTVISDGKIEFGAGGASAVDVNLYRGAPDRLHSDDEIRSTRGARASAFSAHTTGDRDARLRIATDGGIAWGDGSGSFDVRLSRNAPDVMALDAGDGLQFAEAATDLAAPPANGARLYTRDNGSGKTQLVVRFHTGAAIVIATEP
jgi:hypothetical protein